MLPDERTTHSNEVALPGEAEGLIVASSRGLARPLVGFLRGQGLTVRTSEDGDAAFEEALLHPPDVILIDDRVPPDGGLELCRRLKDNVRTHFVPVVIYAAADLRTFRARAFTAGADALFTPASDAQERRARLWALLRTRALYRRLDRRQRTQKTEIVERRHWLSHFLHDVTGQVAALAANVDFLARFAPPATDARRRDFDDSISDARGVFEHLKTAMRTVLDYDRFETGQLVPRQGRFVLGDAAGEVVAELQQQAAMVGKTVALSRPSSERAIHGDRELVAAAMLHLGRAALRRIPPRGTLAIEISESDAGMRFKVAAPGPSLQPTERVHLFEPYARRAGGSTASYGLGMALAGAVIGLHEGRIWVEDLSEDGGGCAFVFELAWQRSVSKPKRATAEIGPGERKEPS